MNLLTEDINNFICSKMKFIDESALILKHRNRPKSSIMNIEAIQLEIETLKSKLTGNLFEDGETQQAIYELKKQLNPAIAENPMLEEEEECLYCGS